jgi:hypothetical protein
MATKVEKTPDETRAHAAIHAAIRHDFVYRMHKLAGHMDEEAIGDLLEHIISGVLTDGQLKAIVEQLESDEEQMDGEIPPGASFSTTCPHCKQCGHLRVASVIMVATGKWREVDSKLGSDGFDVDPLGELGDMKDQSTTDETVLCTWCGKRCSLCDLTI